MKLEIFKLFNLLLNKLKLPKRWKRRLSRHFWREKYFESLLKRLETNSDIDPLLVELDKKRYKKMKLIKPKTDSCRKKNFYNFK